MHVPRHATLIRRMLKGRLARLASKHPLLAASLIFRQTRCGKPSCRCHHGGPKHPAYHLTFKDRDRSRSVYVPKDLVTDVRSWIENHRRHKRLLQEITQLTLALIRGHVQHRKRRQGRP